MAQSDSNAVLRRLPIVVGALGGTLLLVNRLLTPQLTESQTRSDVLGAIISAVLILTGLLWQQIQPKPPETVELKGEKKFEFADNLPDIIKTEFAWVTHLLLTNTVTKSIVIWYEGKVLLRRGILGENSQVQPGSIVERVLEKQKPVYLVNLALYPGRIEFDYLPENTQGLICQPIANKGVLILGANVPRSYTKQDEVWIEGMADKVAETLSRYEI